MFRIPVRFFLFQCLAVASVLNAQSYIVIDHTCLDVSQIPDAYITEIKKMWITVPGESHSSGYRKGCLLLESENARYAVSVSESGVPEAYTDQHLRVSGATWGDKDNATGWRSSYGEEDWYTSAAVVQRTKDGLTYANTNGFAIAAMGFGWCWDMTWTNNPGGTIDPVYQVRWAGSSNGGPEGNLRWGLDADDQTLTGNSVCMDTYLDATDQYIAHCQTSGYATKVFFTTGPVDGGGNTGENGYQRHLKHEAIRNRVKSGGNRILFDYADILTWGNDGTETTTTWTDHGGTLRTFPYIHSDNMKDLDGTYSEDGDHIGERGALRLAKGMWWMLARMAGWPGLDISLSVQISDLSASRTPGRGVAVAWITQSETGCRGFHVVRSSAEAGPYVRVTTSLIPGQGGNSSQAHRYEFTDLNAPESGELWYQIEEWSEGPQPTYHGPFMAATAEELPTDVRILPNAPNPFNAGTSIVYRLPE
ncbi:MAG TPA: hypothetical protein VGB38_08185, partial [bacterium]